MRLLQSMQAPAEMGLNQQVIMVSLSIEKAIQIWQRPPLTGTGSLRRMKAPRHLTHMPKLQNDMMTRLVSTVNGQNGDMHARHGQSTELV